MRPETVITGVVQAGEAGKRRRGEILPLGELRLAAPLRKLVPGADRQAIVAAEDPVADALAQLRRDRTFMLDGEV